MRFSNDNSTWSSWQPFAATKDNWDLSAYGGNSDPGERTVYVQYRDAAANSSGSVSDTVNYEVVPPTGSISLSSAKEWDGDPATLDSHVIRIAPSATDNSGTVESMRFRFDGGTWEDWLPYSSSAVDWTLSTGIIQACGGMVEVDVQYRDAAGNESSVYNEGLTITTASLVVTTTDDSVLADGGTSLREALLGSTVRPDEPITFAPLLYSAGRAVITLGGSRLEVNADVDIQGPGRNCFRSTRMGRAACFVLASSQPRSTD